MSSAAQITDSSPAYRAAMDFLLGRVNFERLGTNTYTADDLKLQSMRRLLEAVGSPEQSIPCIHVAGTKGKGSTSVMIASMLQAAGMQVGLYTSPHRERFEERMVVNGKPPTPAQVVTLVDRLRDVEKTIRQDGTPLTFFELTTAMGWLHFQNEGAEIAVVEVGLGGRLDSTNLCRSILTVITSISWDHMRILGNTLGSIAREKAGIAKPGIPMLSGVVEPEPASAIRERCEAIGAPLFQLDEQIRVENVTPVAGATGLSCYQFDLTNPWKRHTNLRTPLPGLPQVNNTALAVSSIDALGSMRTPLSEPQIRDGLSNVELPLRLEVIQTSPTVIVDAAHNDASIRMLCEAIREFPARRKNLVFASSRDKETQRLLEIAAPAFDSIIVTQYLNNPRAVTPLELFEMAQSATDRPVRMADSPASAWRLLQQECDPADLICVSGSFFLAAEFRELVLQHSGENRSPSKS